MKRLFLDYIILIPSDYYLGSGLTEILQNPCKINEPKNKSCIELSYPPLPSTITVDSTELNKFRAIDTTGVETLLQHTEFVQMNKQSVLIKTDSNYSKEIIIEINITETNNYHLLINYHNNESLSMPIKVRIEQGVNTNIEGILPINQCPYM